MEKILPKPNPTTCRGSTYGQADSRVRIFLYLAGKEGLPENEALSFLKSLDCSKARLPRIDPNGLSLKMLKICSPLIEDGTLRPFSIRWPKSAIISHRHHAECGIPAGFRAGEHDALQFGVHYHAQSGVFRPCQALEAPEHFRRAESYVTNADAGCGLIKYGSALVPFINRFPKDNELYRLMTTRPGEGVFGNAQR